jgi:hypothetical protein
VRAGYLSARPGAQLPSRARLLRLQAACRSSHKQAHSPKLFPRSQRLPKTGDSGDFGVWFAGGRVHQIFIFRSKFPQVAEERCGCAGPTEPFPSNETLAGKNRLPRSS